jgi:hypothetical protein
MAEEMAYAAKLKVERLERELRKAKLEYEIAEIEAQEAEERYG